MQQTNNQLFQIFNRYLCNFEYFIFQFDSDGLNQFVCLKVMTDINPAESISYTNYALITETFEKGALVIRFQPMAVDIHVHVIWINPYGETVSRYRWHAEHVNFAHGPYLIENFSEDRLNVHGLWKIQILKVEGINDSVENDDILVEYDLFVLPANNHDDNNKFELKSTQFNDKFWEFEAICGVNSDCAMYYWSTFYPDPKSDLKSITTKRHRPDNTLQ